MKGKFNRIDRPQNVLFHNTRLTKQICEIMDTENMLSDKKLLGRSVAPEHLSPAFIAACQCSTDKQSLEQELEFLWDDSDTTGKSYEIYLGKISRNPIVKSKLTGKFFALPWSVIIKLALAKGIDE